MAVVAQFGYPVMTMLDEPLLDTLTREVIGANGARYPVGAPLEFRLLSRLLEEPGAPVSRHALIQFVYREDVAALGKDFLALNYDEALRAVVERVRDRLESARYPREVVEVFPRFGYRINWPLVRKARRQQQEA